MAFPTHDPLWAIQDTYIDGVTPNKIRPDVSLRDYGFTPQATVNAQELNWQLNNIQQQIQELKSLSANAYQTPINELKIIVGDSRNPAAIYGYGTWVRFAEGRTLVGVGSGTDANGNQQTFPSGATGGTYQETISVTQMPSHRHSHRDRYLFENGSSLGSVPSSNKQNVGFVNGGRGAEGGDNDNNTFVFIDDVTGDTGGGQPVNNTMPYVAVHIWRRTA